MAILIGNVHLLGPEEDFAWQERPSHLVPLHLVSSNLVLNWPLATIHQSSQLLQLRHIIFRQGGLPKAGLIRCPFLPRKMRWTFIEKQVIVTVLIMNCTICQNLPPLLLTMMMKTKMNISWRKWRQGRSWQSWPTLRRCCIFLQTALSLITAKKWKQKWAAKNKGQGLSRRNWKKRAEQDGKYQDGESCWGRTVGGTELNGAGAVCVFLATSRCLFSRLLF